MQHKLPIGVSVLGILCVAIVAIVGWVVVPKVIDDQIEEQVRLVNGSDTWEKWQDIPFDTYLTFYIFNITNPDEVEQGLKPKLEERGPYAYKQRRRRVNLKQNDKLNPENTVQYSDEKTYWFDEAKSGDNKESDEVNIVNLPFVAVVHGVRARLPPMAAFVANSVLGTETFVKRNVKVGELLFEGFDVSKYTNSIIGGLLPEEFEGGRFGLYKGENGTASETFNIYTGVDNWEDFGKIITFDGKSELGWWVENTPCDKISGTDGTVFPPFFTKDRKIDVFVTDLCRSLRLEFEEETTVKDMKAYRFTVPKYVLEDPRINTDNLCYCNEPDDKKPEACPKAAAMSLEKCRGGAPIMMSTPYYLDGDQGYKDDTGLEPDREKHFTFLDLEPNTGVILRGNKRIQVNVDVKIGTGINAYKNLNKDILFPLVWADESGEIDDKSADEVKSKLLKPLKLVEILRWTFIGVGIALFLAGVVLFYVRRKKSVETV